MVTVTSERCPGYHSGGAGQVRGITGTTALGPAADTAAISSTDPAVAAAAIQPRRRASLRSRVAGGTGRAMRGAAGAPAVSPFKPVNPPCPALVW